MTGPIQIKRPDVADDIRALARLTGASLTDAVASAVKAQLAIERVRADKRLAERRAATERALERFRRLPVVGPKLTDRDLYDEEGMPK